MATLDRPQLRPLSATRVDHQGRPFLAFQDSLGLIPSQVLIPLELFQRVLRLFDGSKSLDEIHSRILRESDPNFPIADLKRLVDELDQKMVLDGPTFRRFAAQYSKIDSRPAALAGRSYPNDPKQLREFLAQFFASPKGSGPISDHPPSQSLRAILCPHIDFGRGGPVYTWAYRELVEKSDANVFVILGVAHQYCGNRFALTRKDFETPLGKVTTNQAFVDSLAENAGNHFFDDELAHRTEHSIEFQAVFLQYLLGGRRDFTIVPILAGSFHDLMTRKVNPIDDPEVKRMVEALKTAEAASGQKVAYIGGIDLCHVGPEFGDPSSVSDATLEQIRTFDEAMLSHASKNDPAGWFETARAIDNRWRVCGLAATYTMLHAIGPARGKILRYDQAVNPSRTCCVTFASVAYESMSPS
jgi:AmmeMemoRadiSam system protein B